MSDTQPMISVVIPAYNVARYLSEAIGSIQQQAYHQLEVIVVDDGSTDGTAAVARKFSDVRCIEQENRGAAGARNTGLDAASGEVIAFLDADDIWLPGHLATLLTALQGDPANQFVWGAAKVVETPSSTSTEDASEPAKVMRGFLLGAGLFRREVFEHVGLFDERLRTSDDFDWFARARQLGIRSQCLPDTVLAYRKRQGSLTSNVAQMHAERLQLMRRSVERQRALKMKNSDQSKAAE